MSSILIDKKIENEEDLASWVMQMKEREQMRNRSIWVDWVRNIIAFHGQSHQMKVTDDLKIAKRLNAKQRKEMDTIVVNFVSPHVRTQTAKLLKARPIVECLPDTSDQADIQAAKVGDRLLRSEWEAQRMDTLRIEKMTWLGLCGNGYVHQFFDKTAGPINMGVSIGEIVSETLSPFKVWMEPMRNNIRKCRWGGITQALPRDEVIEKYQRIYEEGHPGKKLDLPKSNSGSNDDIEQYLMSSGINGGITALDTEYVDIDIVYHLPTALYPNGFYAGLCGKVVLFIQDYPYPFLDGLPILHLEKSFAPGVSTGTPPQPMYCMGKRHTLKCET